METIRKNITLPITVYKVLNDYAKKNGMSFSEFLRESALKEVVQSEKLSLLEYIDVNCSYVDQKEQEEIEALNLDFENFDGREITVDELLQS